MVTLGDVVDAGFRGQRQRIQADEMERESRSRASQEAAGRAAAQALQEASAAGMDRPAAMLKGAERYGDELIRAGDMRGYLEHEAKVQPLRMRTRAEAIQQFKMDGDKGKLIRSIYATIPNGEDVVGVEEVAGGPMPNRGTNPTPAPMKKPPTGLAAAVSQFDNQVLDPLSNATEKPVQVIQPGLAGDGRLGAPSGPGKLRVRVSKGGKEDVRDVDFDGFMKGVMQLAQDPVREIELNYRQRLADIEAGKQIKVAEVKGDQQRKTGEQMAGFRRTQAQIDAQARSDLQKQKDDAAMERGQELAKLRTAGSITLAQFKAANGGGGGGRGSNRPVATRDDDEGYTYVVMPDGTPKYVVGPDGKKIKSLNFQKMLASAIKDVGRNSLTPMPLAQQRAAGEALVAPTRPPSQATPPAGDPNVFRPWK